MEKKNGVRWIWGEIRHCGSGRKLLGKCICLLFVGMLAFCWWGGLHKMEGPRIAYASAKENAKTKLKFIKKTKELRAGKTQCFKVNIKKVKWASSDKKIARVSKTGEVMALRCGKAEISATHGDQTVSVRLKVTPKKIIGIDAGHQKYMNWGKEPNGPGSLKTKLKVSGGTMGKATGKWEYQLTLEIALKLKEELENNGYQVVMTRTENDVNISNRERALKLNKKCDIAVRIHADGSESTGIHGASVLYPSNRNPYVAHLSKKSKKLSKKLIEAYCAETGIKNNGVVARDDLTGSNWSTIPVALIEMGYMTNSMDDCFMASESGQKKMVKGIAAGIEDFL